MRIGDLGKNNIEFLQLKLLILKVKIIQNTLHIYARKEPANTHNLQMLISVDIITENIANIKVNETLSHNQSETCGLA